MTRYGDQSAPRKQRLQGRGRITRRHLVGGASAMAASLALHWNRVSALAQDSEPSIIIGTLGEATTINPFLIANESEGDWRCKQLFDEFVRANPATYALEPGLAQEWSIDNLDITFKLQPNAKFADGSDVTADDVAFTIKGFIAKETGSPRQTKYLSIAGAQDYADGKADDVSGIKVGDPKTLMVTLAKPDAPFLYNMRFIFVVPKAALEGKSLTDDPFFQNPVGAGPYVFQSWTTGADFVATKNPNYWQEGKP